MYRTAKKKIARRLSISAAVALGAVATGAGIAGASSTPTAPGAVITHGTHAHPNAVETNDRGPCNGGVVSAVTGTSITVQSRSGTSSIFAITSNTIVTKDRATATSTALAIGEEVHIVSDPANPATAQRIDIVQPSVMGKVTSVNGDDVTVQGPNNVTTTIVVNGATTYSKDGSSATLGDVTPGTSIFAEGLFASGGTSTLDATSIGIGVAPERGRPDRGEPLIAGPGFGGDGPAPGIA